MSEFLSQVLLVDPVPLTPSSGLKLHHYYTFGSLKQNTNKFVMVLQQVGISRSINYKRTYVLLPTKTRCN